MAKSDAMVIEIGNCLVSTEIITECFCCDYSRCKGKCCVVGDSGAPLSEQEKQFLENCKEQYLPYMAKDGLLTIAQKGASLVDSDGDLVTPLVESDGRCAYSVTDAKGFTYCAVERGYEAVCKAVTAADKDASATSAFAASAAKLFRKPLSCWIFPIRLKQLSNGYTALFLSREHLCREAFAKGKKEGIKVYQFLKEPLMFAFGEHFYSELHTAATALEASKNH